ncbi:MAG: twin transmembrane helix small protein [Stagnimonas sp.]|nr:twin transmembrane helix small protein [Stagnimonas sp.]
MLPKIAIVVFLLAIVVALFTGMYYMLKDPSDKRRTVRALTWRVGLQLALIAFLVLAYALGWIQPHGLTQR